jgi:phosphohistidine phosphatase
MRHGPAEDTNRSGLDADRELSPTGRERMVRVAEALVSQNETPLTVVSSPFARALQSAEMLASLGYARGLRMHVQVRRELAIGGNPFALLNELRGLKYRRTMLVGHDPDLTTLLSRLLGPLAPKRLSKAAVVSVSIPDDVEDWVSQCKPRFALDPKTLVWTRPTP